jgi:hypothetical protein
MYMVIRHGQTLPGKMEEVVQAAEGGELWSVVSSVPGFVEYYFLEMGDVGFSISVFETQEAAEESTRKTMDFIRQHPTGKELMTGPYEIVAKGEVRVHKVKQA